MTPVDHSTALKERSILDLALKQFDAAADRLQLSPSMRRVLRQSRRELTVSFPVRMRDNRLTMFTGFRVHHNIVRGPAAGGIRYHPELTIDTVRALALWSTWRSAIVRIPFGGAYGGVVCDPTNLDRDELEHLTRRFTTEISILIGPDRDIPSPDRSTDAQIMGWMMDTFSMHAGYSVPAVVTGKPVAIGGSQGWARSSGRGTAILCRELAKARGLAESGARIAIQGVGPIGATAAQLLADWGDLVVALGDGQHGVYDARGLAVASVLRYYDEHESLRDCPYGTAVSGAALAAVSCDILVLSGFERIDGAAARLVDARLIVEGAYGAITADADAVLEERGIWVLPDILGGSGGAVASYFEWVQDLQETFWTEDEINERLDDVLRRALSDIRSKSELDGITLRLAAYCLAVERVADAHRIRGLYP
ncbi:MAG TPA: Glu/Leu/Phe/Val dehydrogenase [Chloroflexota bacterium]|nr:Glu/Leu/Phe/Val dehydrogenase [Chloroflexota bacterium]